MHPDIGKTIESVRPAAPQAGLAEALAPFAESLQRNLGALSQLASRAPAGGHGFEVQAGALSQGLGSVVDRLAVLTQVVSAQMATSAPAGAALDLAPYLAKLDQTMTALAEALRGGEVVRTLDPGVYELLARVWRPRSTTACCHWSRAWGELARALLAYLGA